MYLTKIEFKETITMNMLRDAKSIYEMHRTIFSGFNNKPENLLFRVENGYVLVLSSDEPKYDVDYFGEVQTKPYTMAYKSDQLFSFRMRANPTVRKMDTRKNEPIRSEEELVQWIMKKAKANGFDIQEVMVNIEKPKVSYKGDNKQTHHSVLFNGVANVVDADKFKKSLMNGIGRAKSYGFGMMSVKVI